MPLTFGEYSGVYTADICRIAVCVPLMSVGWRLDQRKYCLIPNLAQGVHGSVGAVGRMPTTPEELEGLRAEADLAKKTCIPAEVRGPCVLPGQKPGLWRGQAYRPGTTGGGRRFRNRGGKHRAYYAEKAKQGRVRQTPGKSHPDYAASAAWHKERAAQRR